MSQSDQQSKGTADRLLGKVTAREQLGSMVWLEISVPGWGGARPGQFAMLHAEPSGCFLPRAFSVAASGDDSVSFLVAPIGVGSGEICGLMPRGEVWVTGPLGNGFDIDGLLAPPIARIVIVAGGVGVAPFPLLLHRLTRNCAKGATDVLALVGFRDARQGEGVAPLQRAAAALAEAGGDVRIELAFEDGSYGPAQRVTDLLAEEVRPGDRVVACGPSAMSKAVWQTCRTKGASSVWFSLETVMACGVGSCHGCALTLADGSMVRVCRDGPVFAGHDVYGGEPG